MKSGEPTERSGGIASSLDAILKHGLDRSPLLAEAGPKIIGIDHANLRGPA